MGITKSLGTKQFNLKKSMNVVLANFRLLLEICTVSSTLICIRLSEPNLVGRIGTVILL